MALTISERKRRHPYRSRRPGRGLEGPSLALQNHKRHRGFLRVRNRQVRPCSAKLYEKFSSLPVERNRRPSSRKSSHLYVLPSDTAAPTCSDGLHASFLCGEPGGIALCLVGFRFAIPDLVGRENTLGKAPSKPRNRPCDTVDFCDVNTASHDHAITIQHPSFGIPMMGMVLLSIPSHPTYMILNYFWNQWRESPELRLQNCWSFAVPLL
jgi:hypothetical protein